MVPFDRVEGVDAMKDVDLMASTAKGSRKAVDVSRVAAKAMGAEECRDHTELQRRPPVAFPVADRRDQLDAETF
jgi:hypothetical protein